MIGPMKLLGREGPRARSELQLLVIAAVRNSEILKETRLASC